MGRYDDNMREVYNEIVYRRVIKGIYDLNKYDPLALPFYACLHAMVSHKRRIFDSPDLWIRIGGDRIKCLGRIYCIAADYEYHHRDAGRRETLANNPSIGKHPIEMVRLVRSVERAYQTPVESETMDLMSKLDNFLIGMTKEDYTPLENAFAGKLSSITSPIAAQVEKLKIPGIEVSVDANPDHIETTLGVDNTTKVEFKNYFSVDNDGLLLVHKPLDVRIRNDLGDSTVSRLAADNIAAVTKIVRTELDIHHTKTLEAYAVERAKLDKYNNKIVEFEKEATEIYNKYYKVSVEEIRDAQNLGKVTV
jgi:hypothetical protein